MKLTEKALTKKALTKISADPQRKQRILSRLALALSTSEMSVRRYIKGNKDELTKVAAVQVLVEELGLSEDEILESDNRLSTAA